MNTESGTLTLIEYEKHEVALSPQLLTGLAALNGLEITPTVRPGVFAVTAERVGVAGVAGVECRIQPRFGIRNALFLISYSLDPRRWFDALADLDEDATMVEALALVMVRHLRRAFSRGLLQGYPVVHDSLLTVRGRIRVGEQVSRRFGRMPPVEVECAPFSEDTLENQLLKAALRVLAHSRLRNKTVRADLAEFEALLAMVSDVAFRPDGVPVVHYTPLNAHYRPSVELARLILRSASIEHRGGVARGLTFLVNMADVFEDFVVTAMRERLPPVARLLQGMSGASLWLDVEKRVRLEPDISIWRHGACDVVADTKYKATASGPRPGDVYQMLAYLVATDLRSGTLVYASGQPSSSTTNFGGKTIDTVVLDVSTEPAAILEQVARLTERLMRLRAA